MTSAPVYDLLGAAFAADPAPVLHRMRRDHPVYRDPTLGTWVLTRFRDVERVVKDPAFSVDRGGSISRCDDPSVADELAWCSAFALRWMVFADPPRQTRLRAAVHRELTSAMVEHLRPVVAAATHEALAAAAPSGRNELLADFAVPVPARVTAALLGLPAGDVDQLKRWTADMFALFGAGVASAAVVRAAHASMRAAHAYFADEVARRQRDRDPRPDLLSALVRARRSEAGQLDDDDLIGLCVTMVAGAYETTTHLVGNGVLALLRHGDQLEALRRDPARIPHAVEEIFRYDGPAVSVVRRARDDVRVDDQVIPAGDNVYCMLYAANRDPDVYPDPDRFDVARSNVRHLGLGHGIHFCVGAALSRLEAAVMLGAVVGELDGLALDRDALAGGEPTFVPNLAIRGVAALPLRFDRYRLS
jgi:cytochrome P450